MRNFNVITNGLDEESEANDVKCIYKEVVIIGNGPSGITLSYLLNGHRPYYNKIPHPDPMLSARLIECTQKSLLHQDLSFLSQGIEGRSKNPISLLVDAMTHPGADMGLEWPSLLIWKKTAKSLDHIVLGKGEPGGTWPNIPGEILTVSPGRWMALPGLEFKEYHDKRAPASAVAKYYIDYIKKHDLTSYMATQSTVTMIQPILCKARKRARWKVWVNDVNGGTISYECRHLVLATGSSDKAGFLEVPGEHLPFITHSLNCLQEHLVRMKESSVCTPPVMTSCSGESAEKLSHSLRQKGKINGFRSPNEKVLCNSDVFSGRESESNGCREGNSNMSAMEKCAPFNKVRDANCSSNFSAESISSNFSENSFSNNEIVRVADDSNEKHYQISVSDVNFVRTDVEIEENNIVLVVGAGLSAADAILAAWKMNYFVVHAFRNSLTTTQLPATMYPEYHELYRLMRGLDSRKDYLSLSGHQVTEFFKDNTVQLTDPSGNLKTIKVSVVAILIGSQPDLSFLPKALKNLGVDSNKPVDCKLNPVQIDPFSYKCIRAPPGLYALGPLVGDNFVRFLQGGALAIAGHIFKDNNLQKTAV